MPVSGEWRCSKYVPPCVSQLSGSLAASSRRSVVIAREKSGGRLDEPGPLCVRHAYPPRSDVTRNDSAPGRSMANFGRGARATRTRTRRYTAGLDPVVGSPLASDIQSDADSGETRGHGYPSVKALVNTTACPRRL